MKATDEHSVIPLRRRIQAARAFLLPKLHRVGELFFAQGITMAGNMVYALLCIRLLPVEEYAKFVIVFAIQGSLIVLMDVGISGSIGPLVGERVDDRQLIADYIASLRQLAHWLFAIVAVLAIFAYPLLVRNRHWSWQVVAAMIAILLVSTWCGRVGSAYGTVLLLLRDRKSWYRTQMISSYGTLALLGVFLALHLLNGFVAILINVAGIVWCAAAYYWRARQLLGVAGVPSREKRTAIVQLTLPAVPSVIFFALQGQLTVVLIAIFGRTAAVASVGALGRLGQLFALFSQTNEILVLPYFARLAKQKLKAHYLLAVSIGAVFGICVVALARAFPEAFLWVLGPKYAGLRSEVVLVMASGALGIVGGLMATINGSRRFIYYSFVLTDNILTLIVQAIFIWKVDLSSVKAVLWFGIASSLPTFCIGILTAIYGLARGGRRIVGIDYSAELDQA